MSEPACKGTAIQGLVAILQGDKARYIPLLAPHLERYLQEQVLVSSWYPERDSQDLLRLVGGQMQADHPDGNIYEFFGMVTALRDIEGEVEGMDSADVQGAGIYRNMVSEDGGLAWSIKRSTLLWQAYHNTGRMLISRHGQRAVRTELFGFAMPCEELCLVNQGYMRQLARSTDLVAEVSMPSCRARGDDACVWITEYDESVDVSDLDAL